MFISKLSLLNFKNHAERSFDFHPGVNAFTGLNGQGKTNVLDAIYCLCHTKSFINSADSALVKFEEGFYLLQGEIEKEGQPHKISLGLKKGQKKTLKRDQKVIERFSSYIGFLPAVIIAPTDRDLIHEGSEFRRKFFDSILSVYDPQYLDGILQYAQALRNRNAVLKQLAERRSSDTSYLEVWDEKLISLAEAIAPKRKALIEEFQPLFSALYKRISQTDEKAHIQYDESISEAGFKTDLKAAISKDLRMGYSTVGLHKDDFGFYLNDKPVKKFGSQGQQKTFLLALKLANYQILSSHIQQKPLLLLDDIFDKLDATRVSFLLQLISEAQFGQIFLTHTEEEDLNRILAKADLNAKIFNLS